MFSLMWAIPVAVVLAILLGVLVHFVVKSRRIRRSFYHLVRTDSYDREVAYHNGGKQVQLLRSNNIYMQFVTINY